MPLLTLYLVSHKSDKFGMYTNIIDHVKQCGHDPSKVKVIEQMYQVAVSPKLHDHLVLKELPPPSLSTRNVTIIFKVIDQIGNRIVDLLEHISGYCCWNLASSNRRFLHLVVCLALSG